VRVTAACALLDRAYGRPAQSVELDLKLTKNLEQMTLQELQELRERYAAVALASPALVIDHDSIEREAVESEDVPIEADNEQT
jgi:Arc/MetJ family transcription regulator